MKRILTLLAMLLCAAPVFGQTTSTITALPAGGPLLGTEPIPMDQTGCATPATCKTTPAAIVTYVNANAAIAGSQVSQTATQIGYGSSSNKLTGTSDFTWTDSTSTLGIGSPTATTVTIQGPTPASGLTNGIPVNIKGGTGGPLGGFGGQVNIAGGNGVGTSCSSGSCDGANVSITAGNGTQNVTAPNNAANGGAMIIAAGNAGLGNSGGGALTISAGSNNATCTTSATAVCIGGLFTLNGGTSGGNAAAGDLNLNGGNSLGTGPNSNAGNVNFNGGTVVNGTGSQTGGSLVFNPGSGPVDGTIQFTTQNGGNMTLSDSIFTMATPITASSTVAFTALTTGTNADFLCLSSAGQVLIQASACTISSERFKEHIYPVMRSALAAVAGLVASSFNLREDKAHPNHDSNFGHEQVGLIAENVAAVMPECAIYDRNPQLVKSYRPECVTAFLVKAMQEEQAQRARTVQWEQTEIGALAVFFVLALVTRRRISL